MSRPYSLLVLALLVAGGFIVVTTFAFASGTAAAITFGVSIATALAAVGAAVAAPTRAAALLGSSVLVSAWTVLVSLGIFSGATQTWLLFAGGAAVAATALGAAVADDLRGARAEVVSAVGIRAA